MRYAHTDLDTSQVVINGRQYDVDPDTETLVDRREKPRGVSLTKDERRVLVALRVLLADTGSSRLVFASLRDLGLVTANGILTSEGRLLADVLLSSAN